MTKKLIVKTLALCAGSSLLLTTGFADDKDKAYKGDKDYQAEHKYHTQLDNHKLMQSTKIIGATVQDQQGQTLGKIQDLILFPGNGRIEFGLLSMNVQGHENHLTAVPWQLLRAKDGNVYMFNGEREKLLSAKMWDRSATIDFSEPNFAKNTYTHYGLNWDDRMSVGGRVTLPSGTERGVSTDDDPKFKRPQPDGKSTFPELNPEEKEK